MYKGEGKGGPNPQKGEFETKLSLPFYYSTLNVESVSTGLKPNDKHSTNLTEY
jgi:hypothetical protein